MTSPTHPTRLFSTLLAASAALLISACDEPPTRMPPPVQGSLDAELRQSLQNWGALPIGPVPTQNAALVDLGQSLFFDKS
jgi:hypothetical protein